MNLRRLKPAESELQGTGQESLPGLTIDRARSAPEGQGSVARGASPWEYGVMIRIPPRRGGGRYPGTN